MSQLTETILFNAHSSPEGGLLSPRHFLHLGTRAAVDQALTRLSREGRLLRICRGAYVAPIQGRFGSRPPSTESVMQALEASNGETIVANGAIDANALGLTTQVPVREIFLTSGTSRKLRLGNRNIEIKHGKHWQFALGKRPAGMAVRALSWLGPEAASATLKILRSKLSSTEWEVMCAAGAMLPSWMARAVGEANAHG